MRECTAPARAQATLGNRFRCKERRNIRVVRRRRAASIFTEVMPFGRRLKVQLLLRQVEVRQRWAFPKAPPVQLHAILLHANPIRRLRIRFERHWLAILNPILPHPTSVRLADFDPDTRIFVTPLPQKSLYLGKLLHVCRGRPVLADFEAAVGLK